MFLRSRILWRRIGMAATTLVTLMLAGSLVAGAIGHHRFRSRRDRPYQVPALGLTVTAEATRVARGGHLVRTLGGCTECHGSDLGGRVMEDGALMRLVGPNLTGGRGSAVEGYADEDWARAIVHGVNRAGRAILAMPSKELRGFANDDVAAMIAFVQSVPPVDRALPGTRVGLLGGVMVGLLGLPLWSAEQIDHWAPRPASPPPGPTRMYGEYLVQVCRGCHGPELRGGIKHDPKLPASADISAGAMAAWTFPGFLRALREGKRRDGSAMTDAMPWRATAGLKDDELRAIWLALRAE
jgi:mono/diheme cytochrome c family protein